MGVSWLSVNYKGNVDISQPHLAQRIRQHIEGCLVDFPEEAEGMMTLDGVVHWFTYVREANGTIDLCLLPRELAEEVLNQQGLSTHEEWAPLPGSEHKH